MGNYTPAQIAARNRYNRKKYDRIVLCVPKGKKQEIQKAAQSEGKSMTRFILDTIEETIRI